MTRALRKRHLLIWCFLAILLPLGFVSAYLAIPEKVIDNTETRKIDEPLPKIFMSKDSEFLKINIRKTINQKKQQLEIIIKKPLEAPCNLVYFSNSEFIENGVLLGILSSKGVYRFDLTNQEPIKNKASVFIYDNIKKQISINISEFKIHD